MSHILWGRDDGTEFVEFYTPILLRTAVRFTFHLPVLA
jgi:hypothetical protein